MARKKALALSTKYRKRLKELRLTKQTLVTVQESRAGLQNKIDAAVYSVRILKRAFDEAERREEPAFLMSEFNRIQPYLNIVEAPPNA